MHYLVYVSSASHLMAEAELTALLETSRRRNTEDGLSGMLLYKDGSFMQVLEGSESAVDQTFARIEQDSRHGGIIVLRQGETEARGFPDWSMGFRTVSAADLARLPGFVSLGNETFTEPAFTENPHIAISALKAFHRTTD